jgi:hypothetical protein
MSQLAPIPDDDWAVRPAAREPATGRLCVHWGCPRPGHLQPDGETACGFHGALHGTPDLHAHARPNRPKGGSHG